jgi:hypothetical protein
VRAFQGKAPPLLTFDDGIEVVRVLMAAYKSAELGRTVDLAVDELESFVPAVAAGTAVFK